MRMQSLRLCCMLQASNPQKERKVRINPIHSPAEASKQAAALRFYCPISILVVEIFYFRGLAYSSLDGL